MLGVDEHLLRVLHMQMEEDVAQWGGWEISGPPQGLMVEIQMGG